MTNQEKDTFANHEFNQQSLAEAGEKQREVISDKLERGPERNQETTVESARAEVLEHASHMEKERPAGEVTKDGAERKRAITKKDKEQSFNATMREVRSQLSPVNRTLSKVIHQPAVEKTSEFLGNTIARPNAILSGSLFAFLFTAAFYLVARFNGYPLSGSEAIASFIAGWLVGLVIDYLRLLFIGKR